MSDKLSIEERDLSEYAVYYFKQAIRPNYSLKTKVRVFDKDGNKIIDSDLITVTTLDSHGYVEITIGWENSDVTYNGYKRMGLYAGYATNYSKMEFIESTKQLKIYSNNNDLIILIDIK